MIISHKSCFAPLKTLTVLCCLIIVTLEVARIVDLEICRCLVTVTTSPCVPKSRQCPARPSSCNVLGPLHLSRPGAEARAGCDVIAQGARACTCPECAGAGKGAFFAFLSCSLAPGTPSLCSLLCGWAADFACNCWKSHEPLIALGRSKVRRTS